MACANHILAAGVRRLPRNGIGERALSTTYSTVVVHDLVQTFLRLATEGAVAIMDGYDELIRRLRARMEGAASRERSLDWCAADAIEGLQARIAELEQENMHLRREDRETRAVGNASEAARQVDKPPETSSTIARALSIQQAADLLNLSYATVFAHKKNLGFIQVGRVWRVTLEELKAAMSGSCASTANHSA